MIDLDALLSKLSEVMVRDITHLNYAVTKGKLNASEARDLVAYTKLLVELKEEQEKASKAAAKMTDAEIRTKLAEISK